MVWTGEQQQSVDFYIGANVEVSSDVVIAAGAVLEAAPGFRLVIETGVCIGRGVVVQASGGNLHLAAGANLGASVLIVGHGMVGAQACIGAESTLINPRIEADAVVPARSLIGDRSPSRQINEPAAENDQQPAEPPSSHDSTPSVVPNPEHNGVGSTDPPEDPNGLAPASVVYGRDQVVQLMKTLFPHRDMLNGNGDSS